MIKPVCFRTMLASIGSTTGNACGIIVVIKTKEGWGAETTMDEKT